MSELFLIRDNLANRISYYHLMLLLMSLPFDMFYSHIILASFAIHTLMNLKKERLRRLFTWQTLILQSVFWVTVISTIYTQYRNEAFSMWGRHITILILPLLLPLVNIDLKKYLPRLLTVFALTCSVVILGLYFSAFMVIRHYGLSLTTLFTAPFINHNFSAPIKMHATFFSMQLLVALVWLFIRLKETSRRWEKTLYILCCCTLVAGMLQLCSKSILIGLFIIANVAVPYYLLQGKLRRKYMLISSIVTIVAVVGVMQLKAFRQHYFGLLMEDLDRAPRTTIGDSRLNRWKISAELIAQKPVIGYGAGSELPLLHERFFQEKLYSSFVNNLNSHSEYLSMLIKSGIWGLLAYLVTIGFLFKKAAESRDMLLMCFAGLITLISLSENFLDVDKGVIFYSVFMNLFIYSMVTVKSKNQQKNFVPVATGKELEPSLY